MTMSKKLFMVAGLVLGAGIVAHLLFNPGRKWVGFGGWGGGDPLFTILLTISIVCFIIGLVKIEGGNEPTDVKKQKQSERNWFDD